jgi:hypothetical protein
MAGNSASGPAAAPGTERPRRYRPKLRYELIGCGLHGHELLGTAPQHRNIKLRQVAGQIVTGITGGPPQEPPFHPPG